MPAVERLSMYAKDWQSAAPVDIKGILHPVALAILYLFCDYCFVVDRTECSMAFTYAYYFLFLWFST
jgi:hypothetical protein